MFQAGGIDSAPGEEVVLTFGKAPVCVGTGGAVDVGVAGQLPSLL